MSDEKKITRQEALHQVAVDEHWLERGYMEFGDAMSELPEDTLEELQRELDRLNAEDA